MTVGAGYRASLLAAMTLAACAPRTLGPPLPSQTEWDAARAGLTALRASCPTAPFSAVVRVTLREPYTGKRFMGRGALAVDPGRAVRLILLGPGGGTAMDAWVTRERFRFAVPAADILRSGTEDESLPVGFLRWWFLAPLDGRLLTAVATTGSRRYVLRDRAATVDFVDDAAPTPRRVQASRRTLGAPERLESVGASLAPAPGDHATYDDERSGVHVEVVVESIAGAPDPAAFVDPEALAGGLPTDGVAR